MKKNYGYTIVELLIILLVIGIVTTITISYAFGSRHRWDLRGTSREITSYIQKLRLLAIKENKIVRMTFARKSLTAKIYENGSWVDLKHPLDYNFEGKVEVVNPPDFAFNSQSMIIDPNTFQLTGQVQFQLQSPGNAGIKDVITITIYSFGGLKVEQNF